MVDTPFFSDTAKPYISETESKALFERVNEIFWKTGVPLFPLILVPVFSFIPAGFIGYFPSYLKFFLILSLGPLLLSLVFQIGTSIYLANKRKTDLTKLIDEWNRMEGIPKGIYFALGTENGVSSDDFFMSLVPLRYNNRYNMAAQHQK